MSCVYTIEVNGMFYVGSTKDEVERVRHHNIYMKTSNCKLYVAIRANNNEFIFKVHHYFEGTIEELRQEEQKLIDEIHPELNSYRAYRDKDEKKFDKEYNQKYREKNKEEINEKKKKKKMCECGYIFTKTHYARHCKSQKHIDLLNILFQIKL